MNQAPRGSAELECLEASTHRVRLPTECPHRTESRADSASCRLVQVLTDSMPLENCRVGTDACEACCRMTEPSGQRPNGVVASFVHALSLDQWKAASAPEEMVRASERLAWIEPFLEDPSGVTAQVIHGGQQPDENHSSASRRRDWMRWLSRSPRIGLVGSNNLKGLGHMHRDLVRQLGIQDWLLTDAREDEFQAATRLARRVERVSEDEPSRKVRRFLDAIDVLLFVETPRVAGLTQQARRRGIPVVCLPMWEWASPGLDWLPHVDLMLCLTEFTRRIMEDWRLRFGFEWRVEHRPWPMDVSAFPFRIRSECRCFVHINGTDHGLPSDRWGVATKTRRKGLEALLAAARRLPRMSFLIWSQTRDLPAMPNNVELRMLADCNVDLYRDGDVCVQLSRWEGLGLPLLECQAAGLPLITTDAPPMNEHHPLAVVPTDDYEVLQLWPRRWIPAARLNVDETVRVLETWFGRDISSFSREARLFVERKHSWPAFRASLRKWIAELRDARRSRP